MIKRISLFISLNTVAGIIWAVILLHILPEDLHILIIVLFGSVLFEGLLILGVIMLARRYPNQFNPVLSQSSTMMPVVLTFQGFGGVLVYMMN